MTHTIYNPCQCEERMKETLTANRVFRFASWKHWVYQIEFDCNWWCFFDNICDKLTPSITALRTSGIGSDKLQPCESFNVGKLSKLQKYPKNVNKPKFVFKISSSWLSLCFASLHKWIQTIRNIHRLLSLKHTNWSKTLNFFEWNRLLIG